MTGTGFLNIPQILQGHDYFPRGCLYKMLFVGSRAGTAKGLSTHAFCRFSGVDGVLVVFLLDLWLKLANV